MGYYSDVRFRLKKKDYENLVVEYNKAREKSLEDNDFQIKCSMSDLFGDRFFLHKEQTFYKDKFDYKKGQWKVTKIKSVYFGWDSLKWYKDFNDVKFVMDYVRNKKHYAYARIGEGFEDIEQESSGFDDIAIIQQFADDFITQIKKNEE